MLVESLKGMLYHQKYNKLLNLGLLQGLVKPFEPELIERLRNIYYGSVPASIMIGSNILCGYKCYDRSMLLSMGMDDFLLMRGNIKSLEIHCGKDKAGHGWVESNGWVYDTTKGLKIERDLYYKLEQPTEIGIYTRDECLKNEGYSEILNSTFNESLLNCIMPLLDGIAVNTDDTKLMEEIRIFKEKTNYGKRR